MISVSSISAGALWATDVLESHGFEAYIVGGSVRDLLMKVVPHDFDITTNATPQQIMAAFDGERIIETGLKHGTVTVIYDGEPIEITTYRIEGAYTDNRHPSTVSFTKDLSADLSRRDFTVNAIAYNPARGIVDLYGGCDDIKNKIIRCVGIPHERFDEDGLRILRALRFASVLGFEIEKLTAEAIHSQRMLLCNISRERVFAEFTKLLCGGNAHKILSDFSDVTCEIIPGYSYADTEYIDRLPRDRITRYAAFFASFCDGDTAAAALRSLRADKKLISCVKTLVDNINSQAEAKYLLKALGVEQTYRLMDIREAMPHKYRSVRGEVDRIISAKECFCLEMLSITGRDLIDLGFPVGSGIGRILDILLTEVMDHGLENTYDALAEMALKIRNNI